MTTFYTGCPVAQRRAERFVQCVAAGGERLRVEFYRDVVWLQESESQCLFLHGDRVLKEGPKHNDFYGYLTSCDLDALSPHRLAEDYGINPESSLELRVRTKVYLRPAVETPETLQNNLRQPRSFKEMYAQVPDDWCQEVEINGERIFPSLQRKELGAAIVWSSRDSTVANALRLAAFKVQWQTAA